MAHIESSIIEQGILEIAFFHEAQNSLPSDILLGLADAIQKAGENPEVLVIILKSGGDRTFCAGASFTELVSIQDFETGKKFFSGFAHVINAIRTSGKIVIGRVQGKAIGGGVGLAAAVDHCFATKQAQVKLSELAVGIGPFVVGPAVQRKVGLSAFSQMTLNATELYSAEWAKEKGLYAEVFDSTEEMDAAVLAFAKKLAASNPEALSLLKKIFWEGTEHWNELLLERAGMSGKLVLSDFTRDALAKFAVKS
jgi:methylglutaconyl-CoA hydratase